MYYRKEMIATNYESGAKNLLRPSGMLRYMQQTSGEQLSDLGQSGQRLYSEGMVFLLSKINMRVHRNPVCGERLSVGTAATPPKGVRFVREFVIDSLDGGRLVSCYTFWVLVDTQNHKILRPSAYPYTFPWEEPGLEGVVGDIAIPSDLPVDAQISRMERRIHYSYIDTNAHVNNSVYADFVCDALPYDLLAAQGVACMAISFQREARHGDVLEIQTAELGGGAYRVAGTNGGAPCFEAYVELN